MSVVAAQNKQVSIDLAGGLVTDIPAADLPPGVSPNNQDCDYVPNCVRTRPGTGPSIFAAIAGPPNPSINYLKTFEQPNLTELLLSLDSNGILWQAQTLAGGLMQVNGGVGQAIVAGARGKSVTLFGREFIGLSDGKFGLDIPRQYDATNFDRVSQVGPGAAPTAADINVALTGLSRTAGVISGTTAAPHGLVVGGLVTIGGVNEDATFNSTFPVASTPTATTFTAWGNAGSFVISGITRAAGVVTATLQSQPSVIVGAQVIVADVNDPSYNGIFTVTAINGNQISWAQGGADSVSDGGTLYTEQLAVPVLASSPGALGVGLFISDIYGGVAPGQTVTLAGFTPSGDNGNYIVAAVGNNSTTPGVPVGQLEIVLYTSSWVAATVNGTVTVNLPNTSLTQFGLAGPGGNISAGLHQVAVAFITRQGFTTKYSPPSQWVAGGNFLAQLSAIPTGPSNVVARLLLFTQVINPPATTGTFYSLPQGTTAIAQSVMQINDNTTTTAIVDFSDAALAGGIDATAAATPLASQVELGEVSGFIAYASRLIAWGERNKVQNLVNTTFDGGFGGNTPLGWAADPTYGAGGSLESVQVVWGDAYRITGDGVAVNKGMITQSVYQDYLMVPILLAATAYSVRVRLLVGGTAKGATTINLEIYSPTAGSLGIFQLTAAQLGAGYQEFIGPLMAPQAQIPTDAVLRYYVGNTPANGQYVIADNVYLFPTNAPYLSTLARASGVDDQESFDGVNGLLQPSGLAEPIRAAFILTDRSSLLASDHLYLVTDNTFWRTQDNGGQPSTWAFERVSTTVGTQSINGVDVGEDWAAIAHSTGLYLFSFGAEPEKISQEIAPTWNTMQQNLYTLWVKVDMQNKRVLIGAPLGNAALPTKLLMMNYRGLISSSQIIATPPVHFSTYSGKMISLGLGRKWSIWNIAANCAWCEPVGSPLQVPSLGSGPIFLGNATASGKIYNLSGPSNNNYLDDGNPISSCLYDTSFLPSPEQKEQYEMLGTECLLSYLRANIEGAGNLQFTFFGPGYVNSTAAPGPGAPAIPLSSPAKQDVETFVNFIGERMNVRIQAQNTTALTQAGQGPWFSAQRLEMWLQPNPTFAIRGFN
jgi:hypothetical protein